VTYRDDSTVFNSRSVSRRDRNTAPDIEEFWYQQSSIQNE